MQYKILADNDVRRDIVEKLREEGHDVAWVKEWNCEAEDHEIGYRATEEKRLVLTQNIRDFVKENFGKGQDLPYGVLVISLSHLPFESHKERVSKFIRGHGQELYGEITILERKTHKSRQVEHVRRDYDKAQEQKSHQKVSREREM